MKTSSYNIEKIVEIDEELRKNKEIYAPLENKKIISQELIDILQDEREKQDF